MPPALQPTLMILLAPTAVGTTAYIIVSGQVDLFARSLCLTTMFLFIALAGRLRHLLRCCPFRVGWWAVSFPLAASAVAVLRVSGSETNVYADAIAIAFLAIATAVIAYLFIRTVAGIVKGELKTLV